MDSKSKIPFDERTPQEVAEHIRRLAYEAVWKDWDAVLVM
jgi:hypothetical protein